MTILEIESNLKHLIENFAEDTFIFDLLEAYDFQKSTIKRLQQSDHNLLESKGELILRKKLFFKIPTNDIHVAIDDLKKDSKVLKHNPRFIVVTDFKTLLAYDTKTDDYLDIPLFEIVNHSSFFLPWAGMEKSQVEDENPADIKAAEKMGKLYDEILKNNEFETDDEIHSLNVFLTRLLFCYFAEDTNIFEENAFTKAIDSYTQQDGSDLDSFLERLFDLFNTEHRDANIPEYLKKFPYVNGGLFRDKTPIPKFSAKSRRAMIETGELGWSEINPDIFGSMIQAVVTTEHRGTMGMHYTSVPNILKVIEPLFLDELYEEFEKNYDSVKKLHDLIDRIANIKIFDPACGSGNFLIIAYKKLRTLEMEILKRINSLTNMKQGQLIGEARTQLSFLSLASKVELTQFYGIELDHFAHEVALLSLWIAEHQMNKEFYTEFGQMPPPLPLKHGGNIVHGNATRLNWEEVCPKDVNSEICILGNPPYLGFLQQDEKQKADMDYVFKNKSNMKKLDYISCWFFKGSEYIDENIKCSFVSTNSIIQGEQVDILWPYILEDLHIEIRFAYKSFTWKNNAKNNAGITVVIIGLGLKSKLKKYLYTKNIKEEVASINAYLLPMKNIFIQKSLQPISQFPKISLGSSAYDGGFLMITPEERKNIILQYPESRKFFKLFIGSAEFVRGIERYCLYINDSDLVEAKRIPPINDRLEKVREFRSASKRGKTLETASTPHKFTEDRHIETPSVIVPIVTSERREYLTLGFLSSGELIPNSARAIYNASPYLFGILSSKIHMLWVKAVGGRLRTDVRYSAGICYNSFPFPRISESIKNEIENLVFNILDARENYPEKTLAQLYDPDKMPKDLKEAHHQLDLAIERCYRSKPFENDEERLEYLFKLYEEMTKKPQGNR